MNPTSNHNEDVTTISGQSEKMRLSTTERASELMFGLIMALTFTGTLHLARGAESSVREMLIGALGCNIAWGIIDAIFYLMNKVSDKGRARYVLNRIRQSPHETTTVLVDNLPAIVAAVVKPKELDFIGIRINAMPAGQYNDKLTIDDYKGAVEVFLLVFFSLLPVALPFIFIENIQVAMRVSNGLAVLLLFLCGAAYGRAAERSTWRFGIGMVVIGIVMVAITIALGG